MSRSTTLSLRRGALAALLATVTALSLASPGPSMAAPAQSELEAAKQRLMDLERDFELVVERYNGVQHNLSEIRARIATDETVVAQVEKRMSVNEDAAEVVAEELYKGGSAGALEAVLSSDSLAEIQTRLQYLRSSEDAQTEVFERLAVDRQLLNERIGRLERERARAVASQERLADLRTEIEAKVADQRAEIEHLSALIERAERRRAQREAAAAAAAREAAQAQAVTVEAPSESTAPAAPAAPAAAASSQAGIAVQAALTQVGKPYQWGAVGPDSYDCSGLTMWAWARAGVSLPHNSGMQYAATPRVSQDDWQPGDLLFYGSPIHHVAMYIGGGQVVEAPYSGTSVRVASASRSDYVGAGRPGL